MYSCVVSANNPFIDWGRLQTITAIVLGHNSDRVAPCFHSAWIFYWAKLMIPCIPAFLCFQYYSWSAMVFDRKSYIVSPVVGLDQVPVVRGLWIVPIWPRVISIFFYLILFFFISVSSQFFCWTHWQTYSPSMIETNQVTLGVIQSCLKAKAVKAIFFPNGPSEEVELEREGWHAKLFKWGLKGTLKALTTCV